MLNAIKLAPIVQLSFIIYLEHASHDNNHTAEIISLDYCQVDNDMKVNEAEKYM
jgi:hypothetical protein